MLILALDAALARCSVALVADGVVLAEWRGDGARGQVALLPDMVAQMLAGIAPTDLNAVAATVGPGGFTGVRAALSLANGLALGIGREVVGVSVAEALAEAVPSGRPVWTAIDSRRSRVFLAAGGDFAATELDALPVPRGPVAITGDAAIAVAARLAARGDDVMLTDSRLPLARYVAAVAARRLAGLLPPLPAQPLYVDPPEAKPPSGGLRPAPR